MEYTGKLYGKIGRRLIPLTLTSEDVDRMDRTNADLVVQANRLETALKYASIEIAELRHQIRETLMENLHLADGDDCTLKRLKDAISFELEDSCENADVEAPKPKR
jgi:regulator of replication initiation timing